MQKLKLNESLVKQRDFYEQILNGIPNDIAVFDSEHKYIFINPKGIKDAELRSFLIGKDDFDYCKLKGKSDDLAKKRRTIFNTVIETGSAIEWEDEHIQKDGSSIFVLRKMSPLFNENKEVVMVIGYGVDITSRKHDEIKLIQANEENNRLKMFIDKTNDSIHVADKFGHIVYLNEEAQKELGCFSSDYKGRHVSEFEPIFENQERWDEHFNKTKQFRNLQLESIKINHETGKKVEVELNLNLEEINGEEFLITISRDISEKKKVALELENKRKFQEILITISNKYMNIDSSNMELTMNESLSFVGNFLDVDRVYIFDYNHLDKTSSNTYEWCANGIAAEIDNLQNLPFDFIPNWINHHFQNKEIFIENVATLEDESLREILEPQGIKSLLSIPLFSKDTCIGFVGFDAVKSIKLFSDEERNLLRIFAELIVNIHERSEYIKQIEAARIEIVNYNKYLEERVNTETEKNIELTKSITDQEKLVTIGEISAGIAHDLNTPLGSVKIGIESIDYSLKRIFENFIVKLSQSEVKEIYSAASFRGLDLFQNTSKVRQETAQFRQLLIDDFGLSVEESNYLSRYFVQCQFKIIEKEEIKKFLDFSNTQAALELLYSLQSMNNLVESTKISTYKATEVIKNLSTFVRNSPDDIHKPINVFQTIQTVLTIFSHKIRKKIKLHCTVDDSIMIIGSEVKMFQLWSNIIKNALEAMEEQTNGQLTIESSVESDKVNIHIANNGDMILEQIQKVIFNKFFSTKLNKSGTGLGLSIVNSILEDHNASISLDSNPILTTFTITFNKID